MPIVVTAGTDGSPAPLRAGRASCAPVLLAFDIGGTTIAAGVFDNSRKLLRYERRVTPSFETEPDACGRRILDRLLESCSKLGDRLLLGRAPEWVVIGYPGPIDASGVAVRSPTILGPHLDQSFEAEIEFSRLWANAQVRVLNDLTCAGEHYVGLDERDFCVVTVGSGIGNKIFVNGEAQTGPAGRGGEIGHLWCRPAPGSLIEDISDELGLICSGRGVLRVARIWIERDPMAFRGSMLGSMAAGDLEKLRSEHLVRGFREQDALAVDILAATAEPLGNALAAIHLAVGIERFHIVGGFAKALGPEYGCLLAHAAGRASWDTGQRWEEMVQLSTRKVEEGLLGSARIASGFGTRRDDPAVISVSDTAGTARGGGRDFAASESPRLFFSPAVVGLGVVGALTVDLIRESGLPVIGFDIDDERARRVRDRCESDDGWRIASDPKILRDADVVIVATRPAASGHSLETTAQNFALVLDTVLTNAIAARLVIVESTLPPGTTRALDNHIRARHGGRMLHLAYCPERLQVGQDVVDLRRMPRLVSGFSDTATALAAAFLRRLGLVTVSVSRPEVAELCKLYENLHISAGVSLVGELTPLAHAFGVSAEEVVDAAATKPMPRKLFRPGPGVGGHCLPNDLAVLKACARASAVSTDFYVALERSLAQATVNVVSFVLSRMPPRPIGSSALTILLVGVGFKIGSEDITNSPAIDVVRILRRQGVKVCFSDALVASLMVDAVAVPLWCEANWSGALDAAVLMSGNPAISLDVLAGHAPLVFDAGGGRIMKGSRRGVIGL